ncbi:hypothetical protein [Streptomyces pinistramenti]|uniref:hypothetical protein n=1 Tax=Streptomyces pinistramenti TaxID=2884812 RepID=UPI001D072FF8|nr:hypothetical protein [Streptomyces pinistramenti]MCB5910345.1 hypothetical protein [Streptomyces pinistramenti]
MNDATQWVYGSDPRQGPEPGHEYRELTGGGPLDGQLLDVTGWSTDALGRGAYLITEDGAFGPGGRADYAPPGGDPTAPWRWEGDVP